MIGWPSVTILSEGESAAVAEPPIHKRIDREKRLSPSSAPWIP
jgi:hypothetical protein